VVDIDLLYFEYYLLGKTHGSVQCYEIIHGFRLNVVWNARHRESTLYVYV